MSPYGPSRIRTAIPRLAAGAAAATLLLPVAAIAGTTGAGAEGIGDPYFPDYGNGGYDVSHYDVAVEVENAETVAGTTTITAKATQNLDRFNLDFVLDTTSVKVNGKNATFKKPSTHELVVTPAQPLKKGDKMTVVVTYSDEPDAIFDRGENPVYADGPGGMTIIGEPESAPWWIPSNDHPRDKATYDIAITVPNNVEALTSGRLIGKEDSGSKDIWRWKVKEPTTGYLVPLVTGQYEVTEGTVDGKPSVTAIGDSTGIYGDRAAADFARLDDIIEFLESQFGKYRFNAHGNVISNSTLPFALETQTRPVYTSAFWFGGENVSVVVHEQGHQWAGDNVSVHNWRDIWLNEGFATWCQWRWEEAEGAATANEIFRSTYDAYSDSSSFWDLKIGDPGPTQIFAGQVYDRGAMTVQGLRNLIGNNDVLEVFTKWNRKHEFSDSSTRKFEKLAEKVSGENLDSFFDAWLYSSDKPPATKEFGVPDVPQLTADKQATIDRIRATTAEIAAAEAAAQQP